ncbi:MAG TPA: GAF domain-containing protein [Candidatus Binatia bacterium]
MKPETSSQTRRLAILLDVAKALANQLRLDDLLTTIIGKTAEVLDAERATLFLYDGARNELWSKTADQLEIAEIRFPVGVGIAGDVARTRTIANVADVYADPRFNRDFDRQTGFRTRSVLCMPLTGSDQQLIGVIQVLNKVNRTQFDHEDESLLAGLNAHISVALQRAQLIEAYIEKDRVLEIQNNAKSKMIDHLSHELKTPLAVISGSCGLLQKFAASHDPERTRVIAERLERAIGRLLDLQREAHDIAAQRQSTDELVLTHWLRRCQDLLESIVDEQNAPVGLQKQLARRIAEIYGQDASHKPEALLMDRWIPQAFEALRPDFQHRSIVFEQTLEPVPAVYLPEALLFKSFCGLLRNAIEATPDGGTISFNLREVSGNVRLDICDSGVGIDTELQQHLFHGFVHAGATDRYSSGRPYDFGAGGKGLDLQRIKVFSERHGFKLSFVSKVGAGSAFSLEFPPALLRPRHS